MAVAFSPCIRYVFYGGNTDMFEKKYSMTQEDNVFWAKRNLVDYIWKSANLEAISSILSSDREWTERALDLMLYLTKSQLFYDGNKRIAMLAANKLLIQHGCGVLSVSQDRLEKFFTLLVSYYEDDTRAEELKEFLYNECLDGFKSMK